MIQLRKLQEVSAWPYRSRTGGAVKLRFEDNAFVYLHKATQADLEEWQGRIGEEHWIRNWLEADPADPEVFWQRYDFYEKPG